MKIVDNQHSYHFELIKGKRKVHYTFEDKTEMAEDYNLQTNELLSRFN